MKELFDSVSFKCSEITTTSYSTSFSFGIKALDKTLHTHIYNIYGFVRFADEIVDSFHEFHKEELLKEFKEETHKAIKQKISLNPILNSFQHTVNLYNIDLDLIDTFLDSMEMDLKPHFYNEHKYDKYILGSAQVVGLMCLKVFIDGNKKQYIELKPYAMSLGSAFQKINFLRDIKADFEKLGRTYFPNVDMNKFNIQDKKNIEIDIKNDFIHALVGIKKLPKKSRSGVYLAYIYYFKLFQKIKGLSPEKIFSDRIRIPNRVKVALICQTIIKDKLNIL
jgi:phytoene/squalene synthetase